MGGRKNVTFLHRKNTVIIRNIDSDLFLNRTERHESYTAYSIMIDPILMDRKPRIRLSPRCVPFRGHTKYLKTKYNLRVYKPTAISI